MSICNTRRRHRNEIKVMQLALNLCGKLEGSALKPVRESLTESHRDGMAAQFFKENGMNPSFKWFSVVATIIFLTTASLSIHALAGGKHTFTGEVGDAMCGRKHMEDQPAAECTRACVGHGSKFALIVGDHIYTLETADKAALATLDRQAGKTATVTGTLDGDTIQVSSVVAK